MEKRIVKAADFIATLDNAGVLRSAGEKGRYIHSVLGENSRRRLFNEINKW